MYVYIYIYIYIYRERERDMIIDLIMCMIVCAISILGRAGEASLFADAREPCEPPPTWQNISRREPNGGGRWMKFHVAVLHYTILYYTRM